jgi:uncharacterized protein YraI
MVRNVVLFMSALIGLALPTFTPTHAQSGADGWTTYLVNLRTGPGVTHTVITQLPAGTGLMFEARSADLAWLLGHTEDGAFRGWVASLYVRYREGFRAANLLVSEETTSVATGEPAPQAANSTGAAQALMSVPVLPSISGRSRAIFQGSGNDAHTIIKVGDCNSENWEFLGPFGTGDYNLGPYGYLQPTVDFFRGSFAATSITAHGGFTIFAVTDPVWANTGHCQPNETPLHCELRIKRPAVAVMMFGPNDVSHLSTSQFESALRQVVTATIENGTIPVLTTFTWCHSGDYNEQGLQFNLITVNVAREYDIPLINFWRAAQGLQNCGLVDDTHLSKPVITTTGDFNGEEQRTGYTLRNLLTLQTLDAIRAVALQ